MRSLLSLCTLLILLSTAHAAVFRSPNVKHLTTRTFKKAVHSSDKLTLAAFVAPWCGYCKKLAPEYDRVADSLKGIVNVVSVDCDTDENKPLCGEMGIQGFPTLKMFPGGSAPPRSYDGPRETRDMIAAATGNMPTFVKRAGTAAEVAELREKAASKPVSLLFTSAGKVTPLYKALSTDFHRSIDFYAARDTKVGEGAMKSFGVEKTPALLVLHGGEVSKYDGPLKYDSLHKFLAEFAQTKQGHKAKKTHDDL
ncbi:RHTO0S16e02608g1_1 [Rhodotorula toruloides]|uniref:RHTO0S16e02608g1_1 n=1 Tax=Rhodotorula toruloides TaxID=5286 RepID=A0A061BM81_RHOTO|nr:RHTO0S16e02608g1_1 [Rhodotorula toruloides]